MSADYFGLAVSLMCASAAETIFDRELRAETARDVLANTIQPVPDAVAPVLSEKEKAK
jgi:hypothetical protein